MERSIPFVVGTTSPKVNGGKGFGSSYQQVSTMNQLKWNTKLFIATKLYSIHRESWMEKDDLTCWITQSLPVHDIQEYVKSEMSCILEISSGWTVEFTCKPGTFHCFQTSPYIPTVQGQTFIKLLQILSVESIESIKVEDRDTLVDFGFITDIPNRLLLPLQENSYRF